MLFAVHTGILQLYTVTIQSLETVHNKFYGVDNTYFVSHRRMSIHANQ